MSNETDPKHLAELAALLAKPEADIAAIDAWLETIDINQRQDYAPHILGWHQRKINESLKQINIISLDLFSRQNEFLERLETLPDLFHYHQLVSGTAGIDTENGHPLVNSYLLTDVARSYNNLIKHRNETVSLALMRLVSKEEYLDKNVDKSFSTYLNFLRHNPDINKLSQDNKINEEKLIQKAFDIIGDIPNKISNYYYIVSNYYTSTRSEHYQIADLYQQLQMHIQVSHILSQQFGLHPPTVPASAGLTDPMLPHVLDPGFIAADRIAATNPPETPDNPGGGKKPRGGSGDGGPKTGSGSGDMIPVAGPKGFPKASPASASEAGADDDDDDDDGDDDNDDKDEGNAGTQAVNTASESMIDTGWTLIRNTMVIGGAVKHCLGAAMAWENQLGALAQQMPLEQVNRLAARASVLGRSLGIPAQQFLEIGATLRGMGLRGDDSDGMVTALSHFATATGSPMDTALAQMTGQLVGGLGLNGMDGEQILGSIYAAARRIGMDPRQLLQKLLETKNKAAQVGVTIGGSDGFAALLRAITQAGTDGDPIEQLAKALTNPQTADQVQAMLEQGGQALEEAAADAVDRNGNGLDQLQETSQQLVVSFGKSLIPGALALMNSTELMMSALRSLMRTYPKLSRGALSLVGKMFKMILVVRGLSVATNIMNLMIAGSVKQALWNLLGRLIGQISGIIYDKADDIKTGFIKIVRMLHAEKLLQKLDIDVDKMEKDIKKRQAANKDQPPGAAPSTTPSSSASSPPPPPSPTSPTPPMPTPAVGDTVRQAEKTYPAVPAVMATAATHPNQPPPPPINAKVDIAIAYNIPGMVKNHLDITALPQSTAVVGRSQPH